MSVDLLQERIRKCKNPSMVEFTMEKGLVPPAYIQEQETFAVSWLRFCRELLDGLKDTVPAVRFSVGSCAMYGVEGMQALEETVKYAKNLGFYVVLDAPEFLSAHAAQEAVAAFCERLDCDATVVSPWLGSDVLRAFATICQNGKAVFTVVRSANKSASELQDLLTGARHVHVAAMDLVNRYAQTVMGKYGYSQMGALLGATAPNIIKTLRVKYSKLFFLVDGSDYSGANAKNCSYAFDKFGRGAVVCAGNSILGAWAEEGAPQDPVEAAKQAALRMKKNVTRYVTVM